jgi:hypothetical protein
MPVDSISIKLHFLFLATGTAGDVLPIITLGVSLNSRGHDVSIVAAPIYERLITHHCLSYVALATHAEFALSIRDKMLVATRYEMLFLLRHSIGWNVRIYNLVRELAGPGLIIVSPDRPGLWADLLAHAHLGAHAIRVVIDLPPVRPLVSPSGPPHSKVQKDLAKRFDAAWRGAAKQLGLSVGANHLWRSLRTIRPTIPTIALWPDELTGGFGRRHGVRAFGFVPAPPDFDDGRVAIPFAGDRRKTNRVSEIVSSMMGDDEFALRARHLAQINGSASRVAMLLGSPQSLRSGPGGNHTHAHTHAHL